MAYTRNGIIPIALSCGSPSLIPNNLSSLNTAIVYIHQNDVIIQPVPMSFASRISLSMSTDRGRKVNVTGKSNINQAIFLQSNNTVLLIVLTTSGAQIWTPDGSNMLHFIEPSSFRADKDIESNTYLQGATSYNNLIFIGDSSGMITVVSHENGNFKTINEILTSGFAITCMGVSQSAFVACNEIGQVFCFENSGKFNLLSKFNGSNFSAVSVCVKNNLVFVAFSNGNISLFRLSNETYGSHEILADISAHSRCINALTLHPNKNILASGSEDGYVHMWEFSEFEISVSPEINLVYSDHLVNQLITGITFFQDGRFGVVSYDYDIMTVYTPDTALL